MEILIALLVLGVLGVALGVSPVRRRVVSGPLLSRVARLLPRLGDTERIALEAGTVWWDGQLFSGAPDRAAFLRFRSQTTQAGDLSPEVDAFDPAVYRRLRG